VKHRQLDYISSWDWFEGLAGFAPSAQAIGDDEHFESFLLQ
jgi:hypothetical protein